MARNRIVMESSPEEVFDVLLDPSSYARWVVGARDVRSVDRSWPSVGASLHHSVGATGASVDDRTEIVELRTPELLRLRAYARPLGVADVAIFAHPRPEGCEVVIEESPAPGTKASTVAPLLAPFILVRNLVSLRRLRTLVLARGGG